ncbi:MAG: M48 family metallopeptidase [Pseudomonadota bacterium]
MKIGQIKKSTNAATSTSAAQRIVLRLACGALAIGAAACASLDSAFAPPPEQVQAASLSAWQGIKNQQQISSDPRYVSRMQRVAPRVIRAAGGDPAQWEVQVFQSDQLNAFALPGGKIGFYTGILDLMENDDQIAAVMGHEVAHVKYDHAAKRAGRAAQTQFGLGLAAAGLSGSQNANLWMQALGLGVTVGNALPFSREHELEADREGLKYMAVAGYNPNEAVRFWEKMGAANNGSAPPEFLSTHPGSGTRIQQLKEEIQRMSAEGAQAGS